MSRDLRQSLLQVLAVTPVDPRVPGGREVVWCALLSQDLESLEVEGAGLNRYMAGPGSPVTTYTAVGADLLLMLQGLEAIKRSKMRRLVVRNLETVALEPLTRLLVPGRFHQLASLSLASTDFSAFTYRSCQVCASFCSSFPSLPGSHQAFP